MFLDVFGHGVHLRIDGYAGRVGDPHHTLEIRGYRGGVDHAVRSDLTHQYGTGLRQRRSIEVYKGLDKGEQGPGVINAADIGVLSQDYPQLDLIICVFRTPTERR